VAAVVAVVVFMIAVEGLVEMMTALRQASFAVPAATVAVGTGGRVAVAVGAIAGVMGVAVATAIGVGVLVGIRVGVAVGAGVPSRG
jgi:hypothetical protein